MRLYADGAEADSATVTAEDGWAWSFEGLPKYDGDREIAYTVDEDPVANYQCMVDGYDITNVYTPGKVSILARKAWDDADDQDGMRPDSVTIELYADGEATGRTLVLSEANGWKGAFADLDERSGGSTIDYSVRESDVAGYSCAIAGDMQAGFTVTNTHVPDEPKKPPKPETPKASGMPKTGDDSPVGFLLALAAVSASAIAAYAGLRTGGSRRGARPPR